MNAVGSSDYVMIIGAMKAGTSSLFRLLEQHPALCPSRSKEPEFFSQHQGHAVAEERYEDLFDFDPAIHKLCMEGSTGYTKFPEEFEVPRRIKAYGLEPRFIYIVRDPVDRVISHLNYGAMNSHEWAEAGLAAFHAVAFSMYYTQLERFLAHFPSPERYFIADFEALKDNPTALAGSIFEWLGLPPFEVTREERRNVTPERSVAELRLTRSPLGRWRHLIPEGVRDRAKRVLRASGTAAQLELTALERQQLHTWLAPDMQAFAEGFGFPVEKWGFARAETARGEAAPMDQDGSES